MQENNFEQDVQQSLDGLKVRPAAAVWDNLERELREKKKRRFFFFFSSVAAGLLLLGTAGYFYFSGHNKTVLTDQATTLSTPANPGKTTDHTTSAVQATDTDQSGGKTPSAGQQNSDGTQNSDAAKDSDTKQNTGIKRATPSTQNTAASGITANGDDKATTKDIPATPAPAAKPDAAGNAKNLTSRTATASVTKRPSAKKNRTVRETIPAPVTAATTSPAFPDQHIRTVDPVSTAIPKTNDSDRVSAGKTAPANPPAASTVVASVAPASDTNAIAAVRPATKDSAVSDATAAAQAPQDSNTIVNTTKKTAEPKIRWFGNISAGSSFLASMKAPETDPLMQADFAGASPVFNSPAISPGLPSNAAAVLPPSESHAGIAFQVSAGVQLKLTTRSSVSGAIGYTYNSSRIRVGEYRNVALQNSFAQAYNISARAYTGYPVKSFTDQYHFISLPLRYHFLVNPSSRFRLQWNAGVTPSYMVSSDALVYSPAYGGSYVRDNSAYNRFRISAGTGIDLLFGKNGHTRWSVGPEVSMALRRLSSNPYDNQQRFIYTGLSGRFFFGK